MFCMKTEYDLTHVDMGDPDTRSNFIIDETMIKKLKFPGMPEEATVLKITPEHGIYKESINYTFQFGFYRDDKFQKLGEPWKIGSETLYHRNELV